MSAPLSAAVSRDKVVLIPEAWVLLVLLAAAILVAPDPKLKSRLAEAQ